MRVLLSLVVLLLLLVGGALLAFRSGLIGGAGEVPVAAEVSPEAAASAERKLERLTLNHESIRLTDTELTSLFRYRSDVWAMGAGPPPIIRMEADTLYVRGAVATDQLPSDPALDAVRLLLPDTARIDLTGTVDPLGSGVLLFRIAALEVEGMPIPSRYVPTILERVGYPQRDGLDAEAIEVRLPPGISSAGIENGELLLTPGP